MPCSSSAQWVFTTFFSDILNTSGWDGGSCWLFQDDNKRICFSGKIGPMVALFYQEDWAGKPTLPERCGGGPNQKGPKIMTTGKDDTQPSTGKSHFCVCTSVSA